MKKLVVLFICAVGLFGAFSKVQAQIPNIAIETLTDQQIIGLMSQYQLIGLTDLELEMKALVS